MNVAEFHQNIEQVWQKIEEALENQDCDVDCETQRFGIHESHLMTAHKFVINKQEPLLGALACERLGWISFCL